MNKAFQEIIEETPVNDAPVTLDMFFPYPLDAKAYLWAHHFEDLGEEDGVRLWSHPGFGFDDPSLTTMDAVHAAAQWDTIAVCMNADKEPLVAKYMYEQAATYAYFRDHPNDHSVESEALHDYADQVIPRIKKWMQDRQVKTA